MIRWSDATFELAPLLAEEGIAFNDPDADVDIDQPNAALSYATERHSS